MQRILQYAFHFKLLVMQNCENLVRKNLLIHVSTVKDCYFSEGMWNFLTGLGIMNKNKSHEYFGDVQKLLTGVSYMYLFSLKGSYYDTSSIY
jgi:hypothetical protein